jgi:hypothetical protein
MMLQRFFSGSSSVLQRYFSDISARLGSPLLEVDEVVTGKASDHADGCPRKSVGRPTAATNGSFSPPGVMQAKALNSEREKRLGSDEIGRPHPHGTRRSAPEGDWFDAKLELDFVAE